MSTFLQAVRNNIPEKDKSEITESDLKKWGLGGEKLLIFKRNSKVFMCQFKIFAWKYVTNNVIKINEGIFWWSAFIDLNRVAVSQPSKLHI